MLKLTEAFGKHPIFVCPQNVVGVQKTDDCTLVFTQPIDNSQVTASFAYYPLLVSTQSSSQLWHRLNNSFIGDRRHCECRTETLKCRSQGDSFQPNTRNFS